MFFWYIFYEKPEMQKRLSASELAYINTNDDTDEIITDVNDQKVAWLKLLRYRQTWAFVFGKFMTDGIWWFFLFWLPKYLDTQFGMTKTEITLPLAVLYSMTMIGSIG
jgi:ACS family hexuronate transporter-like MFS transporter